MHGYQCHDHMSRHMYLLISIFVVYSYLTELPDIEVKSYVHAQYEEKVERLFTSFSAQKRGLAHTKDLQKQT